ncbi:MAG: filamentous hemagglutinin N-terminal domain-containing protein, partial [Verrucomicrobiota bacterium]
NRVVTGAPSELLGTLNSNGQVYLINPNGILVGSNATIDTGGFVASTLDVSNEQFMSGADLTFMGDSQASVINQGVIKGRTSDVVLIAREVHNEGIIEANEVMSVLRSDRAEKKIFVSDNDQEETYSLAAYKKGAANGRVTLLDNIAGPGAFWSQKGEVEKALFTDGNVWAWASSQNWQEK